ncbi:MAG: hypothetical protein E7496_11050, partial [Ruminococcus sp.]|nr:hypothetical protein [Ruminococcus sp.]
MKNMKKISVLMLACLLLAGCSQESSTVSYQTHSLETPVDASYLLSTEEVIRETEDLSSKYDYDTRVTDRDGNILSELRDGKWHVSEDGEMIYGLISEITGNGIVAPNMSYAIDLDTSLTEDCLEILEENGLDGCIVVSDMYGKIQAVADYTSETEYYS